MAKSGQQRAQSVQENAASFQHAGHDASKSIATSPKTIDTEEFDRLFDEGSDDIDQYLDWSSARRPGMEIKRVNVDFPVWMIARLDEQAKRRGVARQALIKMWLADRLDAIAS